ncbi:MAG TPA: TaqI-like C-terminal specificity domain-containing protein [Gemmatales bacterium]|nr:TaqI-like C-terminal specificity domain-containing protein [Gemmatales bacterium]
MAVPKVVSELIERFERNRETYKNPAYNETQVRREFLDPFFEAMGWDILNKQGHAEAYKDVIHEDAIKVGSATKAPDYSFRIGGTRKFFVEAKKPSVYLRENPEPAYQLRRYAWSAKLPLSILTDFEEFVVYDCRKKPNHGDKASVSRLIYYTYRDYEEKWDEIVGIFSRDAILKGSFDKYAETRKGKRGTSEVDSSFLAEIESWRELLAKNLAQRNAELSQKELNFAVQRIIDRIIFLRMCEDRGVEDYGTLQHLLDDSPIYDGLKKKFRDADDRYNSGLFHFTKEKDRAEAPDILTPHLKIDDKTLKQIIGNLYYPESPYEFSVLSPEILGQVYEQFLGKVIRLTGNHQAKVEDKPEVRKAGGVYYTPAYIVDYIVKNTVGKQLEGKTPKEAAKLRILDPACGSGSFLVGAYQFLIKWHRDWYLADGPHKHQDEIYQGKGGMWYLTPDVKQKILLNNIHGVDIDAQAVEVTKLSLLLKVLEDESKETLEKRRRLFHERALPDLGSNIKCGNSLIGPDFYDEHQGELFDEETRERINVFDWNDEFAKIMKADGFDVVIGNPPYVRQEALSDLKEYFQKEYESYDGVADLYAYFMEKGVKLLRKGGFLSIIVSSSFLRASYGENLRAILKKYSAVLRIVDFGGLAVFANAKDTYVCIPLFAKGIGQPDVEISKVHSLDFVDLNENVAKSRFTIPQERLSNEAWSLKSNAQSNLFAKLVEAGKPLGEYVGGKLCYGIKTGLNEAFVINEETKNRLIRKDKRSAELIKPLLGGEDIRRYLFNETGQFIIFTRRGIDIDRFPAIRQHLEKWREDLTPKKDKAAKRGRKPGRYRWYEIQDDVAYYEVFDQPKLIFPDIAKGPRFCYDTKGHYLANTAYCIGKADLYLLGILNSQLFWFAIGNISIPFGVRAGEFRYRLIYQYMEKVPVRQIDTNDSNERAQHDRMVKLVERMLDLHQKKPNAKTPQEITRLERDIATTDKEIDHLVYELYGLTKGEIKVVEENTA